MLGNGPYVLGNGLHGLGNGPHVLGNWPYVLGIMSHSALCRIRYCIAFSGLCRSLEKDCIHS